MEHVFRYEVFPLCWFTGIVVIGSTLESTFYDLYKTRGDNGAGPFSAWGGASQASIKNNVTVLSAKMTQGLSTACIPNIEVCPISRGNRFVSIRLNQWVESHTSGDSDASVALGRRCHRGRVPRQSSIYQGYSGLSLESVSCLIQW